jgi:hypothetical protein
MPHQGTDVGNIIKSQMKKVMMLLLAALPIIGRSQSLADVIQQLSLDYQKLAEEKKMLNDMYTAYTVIEKGYDHVRSIAEGNFNLHKAFLDALMLVSPTVQGYYKVGRIIDNEAALVKEYTAAKSAFQSGGRFTAAELDYFSNLYGNLLNSSLNNLSELAMILTAGQLRMSDAERLAAIDRIDADMGGQLQFLRQFNHYTAIQAGQRGIEQNDQSVMQGLYGIGNQ